jgi:hypothetical protein
MTLIRGLTGEHSTVIIVVLAVVGSVLVLNACVGALSTPVDLVMVVEEICVTDVQFETGYLTLTVSSEDGVSTEITEVVIRNLNHPLAVPEFKAIANELVPAGAQISISISYEWISGDTYQIGLTSSRGNQFIEKAVAP